jgi:hypothetical protein
MDELFRERGEFIGSCLSPGSALVCHRAVVLGCAPGWDRIEPLDLRAICYGWTGQQSGSGFSDLAPSILHYNWF